MDTQVDQWTGLSLFQSNSSPTKPLVLIGAVEEGATGVFNALPWPVRRVPDLVEFCAGEFALDSRVVVCDEKLPDGTWRDVIALIGPLHNPPPLIVASRLADDRLWAEVLNLGGFDLLAKPLDTREATRALRLAGHRACRKVFIAPIERS
jgi:hypothetical protein